MSSVGGLCRVDDTKRTPLTGDDIAELPGRVVVVDARWANHGDEALVLYCLRNPGKHGFKDRNNYGPVKGPLTEKEKKDRAQKRVDKAEMTDATVVRRAWIRDVLLQGKITLDIHARWIVAIAYDLPEALRYEQARDGEATRLACELLGLELLKDRHNLADEEATIEQALAARDTGEERLRLLLALAIARAEYPAGNPKNPAYGQHKALGRYLLQLQAWGYQLADVEQRIVTAHTKEQARKRAAA